MRRPVAAKMAFVTAGATAAVAASPKQALAIIAASLGPEQFESAYQHWLNHWKANDIYSPQVEANMSDVMGEAVEKLYAALAGAGFDVLSRLGLRS
jgi:hypothetical protein